MTFIREWLHIIDGTGHRLMKGSEIMDRKGHSLLVNGHRLWIEMDRLKNDNERKWIQIIREQSYIRDGSGYRLGTDHIFWMDMNLY